MDGDGVVARVVGPGSVAPVRGSDAVGAGAVGAPVGVVEGFRVWLGGMDMAALSDRERVDLVAGLERVKGAASAAQARATDAVRCSQQVLAPRDVGRSVGAQVALARRESPTLGERFVGVSRALVHEMPFTMAAPSRGETSERVAVAVVAATATLSVQDRAVVDARVGPLLGRLGVKQAGRAAGRVAAELDAAGVVGRMVAAVRSRRVTVRPAPDGMAYLSVLGPLKDVVGAYAAVQAHSRAVVSGQCPDTGPEGRGVGAVAADTALELLSGRARGQVQPVEVHLVMTDRALLGTGDPDRSMFEPARIPGHGSVPAPVARAWLRDGVDELLGPGDATVGDQPAVPVPLVPAGAQLNGSVGASSGGAVSRPLGDGAVPARVWVRRLYTSPDGRDLVAMDSRRRLFSGLLRRMLVLRDDVCTTPWCEAPIVHADHTTPAREGGMTSYQQGSGKCARCNQVKEAPGWRHQVAVKDRVTSSDHHHRPGEPAHSNHDDCHGLGLRRDDEVGLRRRVVQVTTPLGHRYVSEPPPLLGWGSERAAPAPLTTPPAPGRTTTRTVGPVHSRKRPLRRQRSAGRRWVGRRPRVTSHLERELCRLLT